MKSVREIAASVAVIVGCIIGAGFATGKEIVVFFFGTNTVVTSLLLGVLFAFALCVYLLYALYYRVNDVSQMFGRLFGRFDFVANSLTLFSHLVIVSGMISASNLCLSSLLGLNGQFQILNIVTAVLCSLALTRDDKGLKIVNAVAVPVIVIFIAVVCLGCGKVNDTEFSIVRLPSTLSYVGLNTLLCLGVLIPTGSQLTSKRSVVIVSVVCGAILSGTVYLILRAVNSEMYLELPMPLYALASIKGGWYQTIASIALYFAIVTSLLGNAFPLVRQTGKFVKDKTLSLFLPMFVATLFSLIGFDAIVTYVYPAIAILGIAVWLFAFVGLVKRRKSTLPFD